MEKMLFCFHYKATKQCHLFDGKSVEIAKSTAFEHKDTLHLANYLGKPFTTGSFDSHAKTEIMSLENGEWQSGPDYPFHSSISHYGTASTDSAAYIIGGYLKSESVSTIAEYKNNVWRNIGDLNEPKSSMSSILYNGEYILVGGWVDSSSNRATTELWNLKTTSSRTTNSFEHKEYWNRLLFLVDSNFCT